MCFGSGANQYQAVYVSHVQQTRRAIPRGRKEVEPRTDAANSPRERFPRNFRNGKRVCVTAFVRLIKECPPRDKKGRIDGVVWPLRLVVAVVLLLQDVVVG